jgi:integrase
MKTHRFESTIGSWCIDLIQAKRIAGCQYNSEVRLLEQLNCFWGTHRFPTDHMPRYAVEAWIARREGEALRTQSIRCTIIRQLALHLRQRGIDAWVVPPRWGPPGRRTFAPYIFTHRQVDLFFEALDQIKPFYRSARYHLAMPMLFRLLYCCGLRIGEALRLTYQDVLWKKRLLVIRDSKFNKDRQVPFGNVIYRRLVDYVENQWIGTSSTPLFLSSHKQPFCPQWIGQFQRRLLLESEIITQTQSTKPRIHDWRHTFAVHRLEQWIHDGEDFTARLPLLSAYMGHRDLVGTQLYLHLTPSVFPELSRRMEQQIGIYVQGGQNHE